MAEIGGTLGGRYRLTEVLGQDGRATDYRAHDAHLDRDVAIRLFRSEYGTDPGFVEVFRLEAQAAASLSHPNAVALFDVGHDPQGPFLVRELVDGEELASILRRVGPLPARQAGRIAAEVARALEAAHARGIVHGDLTPSSILISRDGRVKVDDFGIAAAVAAGGLTLPGATIAAVHYRSPEQARGETPTGSSDEYALGCILYEMLTGSLPFEGETAAAIAAAQLAGPIPVPSAVRAGIPPSLEAIDRRSLAREPHDRFPTIAAMAEALEAFIAERPSTPQARSGVAGVGVASGQPGSEAAGAPAARASATRRTPAVPYPDDAYARAVDPGSTRPLPASRRSLVKSYDDEPTGSSAWVWISGVLALLILVVVGYLGIQFLSRPTASPVPPATVSVPNLVGMTFDEARSEADRLGILVVRTGFQPSDQPENTILAQEPAAGTSIDKGGTVNLTMAAGPLTVSVPDLRAQAEPQAIQSIITANLVVGQRTDDFDPVVPLGAVISHDPRAGLQVPRGTAVNYVVSKGPEPSPSESASESPSESPSPSPTPVPTVTPAPTPAPTPEPTPAPTPAPSSSASAGPSPTPALLTVGDYRCMPLADATVIITSDGFSVGSILTNPPGGGFDGTWLVQAQLPMPGEAQPAGTAVGLQLIDPLQVCP